MFIVRENLSYKSEILDIEYTDRETAEECFRDFCDRGFNSAGFREVTAIQLKYEYDNWVESTYEPGEETMSFEDYCHFQEGSISCDKIFEVSCDGEARLFGYDDEIDWNEMLEYRFGHVTSPRGGEARFFIAEFTPKEEEPEGE